MREKVILDVDTGVDDALALWFALQSDKLEILGVTTCFGNVDVETATENTLFITELLGQHIPVYQGAERPVLRDWGGPVPWIHGDRGLGNAVVSKDLRYQAETQDASCFIRDMIHQYPGEITLIPVARMTNIARAFLYEPTLASQVKRIVMMGGAAFCPGNVTAVAEANVWGDPEAARMVFHSGAPITMVGLDVTMKAQITKAQLDGMDMSRPYASILKDAVEFYMKAYEETQGVRDLWCPLHDPLAVAVAEDSTLCTMKDYYVDVETQGLVTSGMTVVDARAHCEQTPNVSVCVDLDAVRFEKIFCERLGLPTRE